MLFNNFGRFLRGVNPHAFFERVIMRALIELGGFMILAVSADTITKIGLYGLLPLFIGFLFFIMWDIAKKSKAGKAGTFWIFVALGMGFFGFLAKGVVEWILGKWFI